MVYYQDHLVSYARTLCTVHYFTTPRNCFLTHQPVASYNERTFLRLPDPDDGRTNLLRNVGIY